MVGIIPPPIGFRWQAIIKENCTKTGVELRDYCSVLSVGRIEVCVWEMWLFFFNQSCYLHLISSCNTCLLGKKSWYQLVGGEPLHRFCWTLRCILPQVCAGYFCRRVTPTKAQMWGLSWKLVYKPWFRLLYPLGCPSIHEPDCASLRLVVLTSSCFWVCCSCIYYFLGPYSTNAK